MFVKAYLKKREEVTHDAGTKGAVNRCRGPELGVGIGRFLWRQVSAGNGGLLLTHTPRAWLWSGSGSADVNCQCTRVRGMPIRRSPCRTPHSAQSAAVMRGRSARFAAKLSRAFPGIRSAHRWLPTVGDLAFLLRRTLRGRGFACTSYRRIGAKRPPSAKFDHGQQQER